MALRNQKVLVTGGNGQVTELRDSVSMPTLSEFTLCLEAERITDKQVRPPPRRRPWPPRTSRRHSPLLLHQKEWLFTYSDASGSVALAVGADHSGVMMVVDSVSCSLSSLISAADFSFSMKMFCFVWSSDSGQVVLYSHGKISTKACSTSAGHTLPPAGRFRLGGQWGQRFFLL